MCPDGVDGIRALALQQTDERPATVQQMRPPVDHERTPMAGQHLTLDGVGGPAVAVCEGAHVLTAVELFAPMLLADRDELMRARRLDDRVDRLNRNRRARRGNRS